jgi:predicted secreted protein
MVTAAIFAHGTLLKKGDGAATEVFTTIAEVTNIGGPGLALDPIDVTSHGSTAGWREFIGGLLDGGEVSMTINYVPTAGTHDATTGLIADKVARTVRNFQLVFPDSGNTTWSFSALVASFEPGEPVDAQLSAEVTLKVTGQPTLA